MNHKVNLLPPELQEREIDLMRLYKIFAAILAAAVILSSCFYLGWLLFIKQAEAKKELAALQREYVEKKQLADAVAGMKAERIKLERDTAVLKNLIAARKTWPQLITDINECVPQNLWFTNMVIEQKEAADHEGGKGKADEHLVSMPNLITIEGKSATVDDIGKFVYQLNMLEHFQSINIIEIKAAYGSNYFNFIITAELKGGGE